MPLKFKAIVKPLSKKESISFDEQKQAYIICVKAPADKGKANKELLKLIKKHTGMAATIASGARSHEKIILLDRCKSL